MKIFQVLTALGSGGAERFVIDLSNELAIKHEVTLVILYSIDNNSFLLNEISSNVHIVSMNKKPGVELGLFVRLKKLIDKEQPDIVHCHLSGIIYTLLGYLRKSKSKYLYTVHSDAKYDAEDFLSTVIRKIAFKFCNVHPVTISEESKKSFTSFYGLPSSVIYNGRPCYKRPKQENLNLVINEIEGMKFNKDAVVIVNVARLNKVKNQLTLAKAVASLNEKGYKIELFNIGDTNDFEVLDSIKKLKSPYVHLLGLKSNPRDYIYVSDAFCLTSLIEGMPITLIECFSVGIIPICTPVGGIKNMIQDNISGILSTDTTQSSIEEALVRFIEMPKEKRKLMQSESLNLFENFSIKTCALKYESLMYSFCLNKSIL